MPNYGFTCSCGHCEDRVVLMAERDDPQQCPKCNEKMVREFPVEAVNGVQLFEPFYHEALDVDITGKRHQKEVYRYFGIQESGDRVGGAKNIETSVHAPKMVPLPPKGKSLSDFQRQREEGQKIGDNMMIGTGNQRVRLGDLPNAHVQKKANPEKVIAESVEKGIVAAKF